MTGKELIAKITELGLEDAEVEVERGFGTFSDEHWGLLAKYFNVKEAEVRG